MQQSGYVSYSNSKPFNGKVLYSFKLKNDETWYGTGTQNPNLQVGDNVEFDFTTNDKGRANVSVPSIRKTASTSPQVSQGVSSGSLVQSKGNKDSYWDEKAKTDIARDLRIQHQSARNAAIETVGIFVKAGILKLPEKNATEAVLGKVAELTEKFYNESQAVVSELESDDLSEDAA